MFRYGDSTSYRLTYLSLAFEHEAVRQWWNVTISFEWTEQMMFPNGFRNPTILMIVSPGGQLLDSVVLDEEGLDSEFVLEDEEKEQLLRLIQAELIHWKHPHAKEVPSSDNVSRES